MREKQEACESTGRAAYAPPARAAFTVSAWTTLIRSMIGSSFHGASAVVMTAVEVPMTWLTYATTFSCSSARSPVIFGSSATVFELRTCAATFSTTQRPFSHTRSKSKRVRRWPHLSGSDRTTSLPVSLFFTRYSAISVCAWPTRIASMPGTCSATSPAAFSMWGSWSPYEDVPLEPECAETTTTSAPIERSFGTHFAACSSRPGKTILPWTFALSQIAMPGLVRPSIATFTSRPCGVRIRCMLYGGRPGAASSRRARWRRAAGSRTAPRTSAAPGCRS